MRGDEPFPPDGEDTPGENSNRNNQPQQPPNGNDNTPASVIFMQMMRQAAADHHSTAPQPMSVPEAPVEPTVSTSTPASSVPATPLPATELQPAPAMASQPEAHDGDQRTEGEDDYTRRRTAALEAQRLRRAERRKTRRRQQTVGLIGGLIRSIIVVVISGGLIATILSWGTSPQSLDTQLRADLQQANATSVASGPPTLQPTPNWLRRVGIISGHRGPENDPGAVCPDGMTENELNFAVAQRVVLELRGQGYTVDLLEEFDVRLNDYRAAALVSIHSNDCGDYGGEFPSGFLVAQAEARPVGGEDTLLAECIAEHYGAASQLDRRFGLTRDMTDYHVFREINITTPGVIVELGFMLADRDLLENQPDLLARGLVDGILCFLEADHAATPTQPGLPTEVPVVVPQVVTPGG